MKFQFQLSLILVGAVFSSSFSSQGSAPGYSPGHREISSQKAASSSFFSINSAESLPNALVPLNAKASDYAQKQKPSSREKICQGGLEVSQAGELRICCALNVQADDILDQSLFEVSDCDSEFQPQNSSCALDTLEGVVQGRLWSCDRTRVENFSSSEDQEESEEADGMEMDEAGFDEGAEVVASSKGLKAKRLKRNTKKEMKGLLKELGDGIPKMESVQPLRYIEPPSLSRTPISVEVDPESMKFPDYFELAHEALLLGEMPKKEYLSYQKEYTGEVFPACNFFLTTALCMAGYCQESKPFYLANHYHYYFDRTGWERINLTELKRLFRERVRFDSVIQLDSRSTKVPGHVAVPVGLDERGRVIIAEGNLGRYTNRVKTVSDSFITSWRGGFKIFVKRTH